MSDSPQPEPRFCTVLSSVLAPVFSVAETERATDGLSHALTLARAGISLNRREPQWLEAIDELCLCLQRELEPLHRAQQVHAALQVAELPTLLQPAAQLLRETAAQERRAGLQHWMSWREGTKGRKCVRRLRKALKRAGKTEPEVWAQPSAQACVAHVEAKVLKCQKQLLQKCSWRQINAFGQAKLRLQLSQHYLAISGFDQVQAASDQIYRHCYQVAAKRVAVKWLKRQLKGDSLDAKSAAACGAMWQRLAIDRVRSEQEIMRLLTAVPALKPVMAPQPRPDFPLELHFGAKVAAVLPG